MSEYDSILKEKKIYQEPIKQKVKKKKHFPYLLLDFIFVFLVLVISYYIYYRTILAPDKIFISNISKVINDYQAVFKYLPIQEFGSDYYFEGTLSLDEDVYNYDIIKNQDKFKVDFSMQKNHLIYYLENKNQYIKLSNLSDDYFELKQNNLNELKNIKKNVSSYITEEKYIKRFYFDGYIPVVEASLVLKDEDIRNIMTFDLKNQYEVLFTFKNNAFTNEIISMKMTINNLGTNERQLVTYQNGKIIYSDGEEINLKFVLSSKDEDFNLKVYKDDVLYSVLSGTKQEESYRYMYQIIDQIYNISLVAVEDSNDYVYDITSNIEKNGDIISRSLSITLNQKDNIIIDEDIGKDIKKLKDFTEDEKRTYNEVLDSIIGDLRQLIKEYK